MGLLPSVVIALSCCADLPPGFERTVYTDQLDNPLAIDFFPDGRMLVGERIGAVKVIEDGQPRTLLTLTDIATDQEGGVLGMAVDPDFDINPFIYLYYTSGAHEARIGRFTIDHDVCFADSEVVIWQNPQPETGFTHHGGNLAFAPDGKLYLATGEETESQYAQDLTSQRGKILRMNRDGSVPADNPFVDVPGAQPLIFARGFRNPFRCAIDPVGGALYVGDVGQDTWEEVDRISAGDNGGWPDMEGPLCYTDDCSGFRAPIWVYEHCDPDHAPACHASVILGPVYRAQQFPPEFRGNIFVADLLNNWIRRLVLDAQGDVVSDLPFASGSDLSTIVDMKVGPDGAMYYVGIYNTPDGNERVFRIGYAPGADHAPSAMAGASPTSGPDAPLTVQFDASLSTDDDTAIGELAYAWDFGDGTASSDESPQHVYTARGQYTARLTVGDGQLHGTADVVITVGSAPEAQITAPADGAIYRAGDTINFAADASDAEDGPLGPSAMTWDISVIHGDHTHPFLGPLTGIASGSFVIPTTGHPPEEVHYRLKLRVTDSDGIRTVVTSDIYPEVSTLQLDATVSGVPLTLDGNPVRTPRPFSSVTNFHHVVIAPPVGWLDGWPYRFMGWTDGPTDSRREFDMPAGGLSLTADYEPFCLADFNLDTFVTGDDFDQFTSAFDAGC